MRYTHVSTACGCGSPTLTKALGLECANSERLAKTRRPVTPTEVGRYVNKKQRGLAVRLSRVLRDFGKSVATKIASGYGAKLLTKADSKDELIQQLIDKLNAESLGEELSGELENATTAAFRRAAKRGATQVGLVVDDITSQVDKAAVDYTKRRGGELIKDLAGTTEKDMRSLLERAVSEGMSVDDLAEAIEGMGAFGEARAQVIARTELASAHVQGNVQGWQLSGLNVRKRSLLGDLHDVADICDECADAGEVDMEAEFVDGATFPPYHPNCICDIEPVVVESETEEGE